MEIRTKRVLNIFLCVVLFIALITVISIGTIQNNRRTQELKKVAEEGSYLVTPVSQNQDENTIINP